MLVEFSVVNFKSIKDHQTLDLVAAKGKEIADNQTLDVSSLGGCSGIKLLPAAVIYGANTSGKSNLLEALHAMKVIIMQSTQQQHRRVLRAATPFKLDPATRDAPTEFEVIFIAEGVRYQYGFSVTPERIVDEWLLAYPKNRTQDWLAREWIEKEKKHQWHLGASLVGEKKLWQKSTRDDALFLSTAVQLNSQQLQPVFNWFFDTLRIVDILGLDSNFTASLCDTKDKKDAVLEYVQAADLDIDNILVEKEAFGRERISESLPKPIIEAIAKDLKDTDVYRIQMVHHDADGKPVVFDIEDESEGTQKFFSFAGPWIEALENGYVVLVDELDNSLHPKLVKFLVSLFNDKKTNPNNAQLIFTTHDTTILHQQTIRRDQVWFCEKDMSKATKVYPLSYFRPRKDYENLEMTYLCGGYGGLPCIRKVYG